MLPATENTPLVRTHFGDDAAWAKLVELMKAPQEEDFVANLDAVDDKAFEGLTAEQAAAQADADAHAIVLLADQSAIEDPDKGVIVVDLDSPGKTFRVIPSQAWSVENNLSLANMDYADFLGSCDANGVFRGFPA